MHLGITETARMTPAQQTVYDAIAKGPRGMVPAVLLALMDAPELTLAVQAVGRNIIYEANLAPDCRELAILTVAVALDSGFEWKEHFPLAREAGVPQQVCDAARNLRPQSMPATYANITRFCLRILKPGALAASEVEPLKTALGARAVTEIAVLVGYYQLLTLGLRAAGMDFPLSDGAAS